MNASHRKQRSGGAPTGPPAMFNPSTVQAELWQEIFKRSGPQ